MRQLDTVITSGRVSQAEEDTCHVCFTVIKGPGGWRRERRNVVIDEDKGGRNVDYIGP